MGQSTLPMSFASVSRKVLLPASLLALSACGGSAPADDHHEEGSGSGGESAYAGPITSTDLAGGEAAYQAACAPCHENGAPTVFGRGWEPARMRQQIREGEDDMPPIPESRLSNEQMEALLAYIESRDAAEAGAPADPQ